MSALSPSQATGLSSSGPITALQHDHLSLQELKEQLMLNYSAHVLE